MVVVQKKGQVALLKHLVITLPVNGAPTARLCFAGKGTGELTVGIAFFQCQDQLSAP